MGCTSFDMRAIIASFMRSLLHYIQYLLVAAFWWLYRLMPVRWSYAVGWGVGAGLFALLRRTKRARTSIDNVIIAGLAKTRREAYLIARNALGHFAGHICEALRVSHVVTQENWRDYVELEMSPAAKKAIFEPSGPLILATGHLGAWEAGITAITSVRPMFAVARLMDNPYIQRFLERHNFRGGATIIPKKQGFSASGLHRVQEEKGALAILFDQHASNGVTVKFFGIEVPVYTSPVRVHYRTGAPIVVGGFLRTGTLKYKMVVIGDPIELKNPTEKHSQEDMRALTQELISRLEKVITMAPDQYLWLHRRFRQVRHVPEVPEK